jgi:hypothetical protein
MRLGIEHNCSDKDRRNPRGRVVGGHQRRANLDDKPCNHCIAARDAINLPFFQLTEERLHLSPRRLRIIRYFIYYVEPAARNALLFVSVRSGFT